MKRILTFVFGINFILYLKRKKRNFYNFFNLAYNFVSDFSNYYKDSTVFDLDNINKIEAIIILHYHAIEKGFIHKTRKPRFAKDRIMILHENLSKDEVISIKNRSQINVAYKVMCKYYEWHIDHNIDVSDFFSEIQYLKYKGILEAQYVKDFEGIVPFTNDRFFSHNKSDFSLFSSSRRSVRDFTGEMIDHRTIENAVNLSINSPSVCNRQSSRVYLIEDKTKIDKILHIQSGFRGYSSKVFQLLILTVDRNYFYTVGERNQFYIDGGIFLLNLLYSLHYYKIANCPANWGKPVQDERRLSKVVQLPDSEKIICLVPIGIPVKDFSVCLSQRRDISEVFFKI